MTWRYSRSLSLLAVLLILPLLGVSHAGECAWTGVDRIVAVGDVHGDFEQFVKTLRAAKVIDDENSWIGGKTHLVQAVGNEILKNNPSAHVVYISTEQFVQEFLDAIRFKKNTDFADHYRSADVLIIDDIQFIAGKEKTQD